MLIPFGMAKRAVERVFGVAIVRTSVHLRPGKPVLLACIPKSGSTFISGAIMAAMGYPRNTLRLSHDVQEFDPIKLLQSRNRGVVSQSHMMATDYAVEQINKNDIRTIVLERDFADAIVSNRDHIVAMAKSTGPYSVFSQAEFFDSDFLKRPIADQYDHLIETVVPWFARFHASWRRQAKALTHRPLFITYEMFFSNPENGLKLILAHLGRELPQADIKNALARVGPARINIGKTGRGATELTAEQHQRIREIAAIYRLTESD